MKAQNPAEITELIRRHKGHLILEAGAGTGKTYNLTERVIYQLTECHVPLERILALTFTDFAAAEMRSRIYEAINRKLYETGESEQTGARHIQAEDMLNAETLSVREHLQLTRRRFSRNYISTFHSFCHRVLQYFPDEVTEISVPLRPVFKNEDYSGPVESISVDGSFDLLSDYDEVLWMLEWKKSFYRMYKDHPGLQRQLSRLTVSDFEWFMQLLSGIDEYALYEMADIPPKSYIEMLNKPAGYWRGEIETQRNALIEEFSAHPEWFKRREDIPKSMEDLKQIRTGKGFSKKVFDIPEMGEDRYEDISERGREMFEKLDEVDKLETYVSDPDIIRGITEYPDGAMEWFDANHESYWNMRNLSELALRWNTLMRYKRFETGFFNYDDMIWLTHTLLETNPVVVNQIRRRFDQILVDEFQDTDRRQWEIIRKLAFGNNGDDFGKKGGEAPRKKAVSTPVMSRSTDKEVLIVGDVKQAIYGFRGGDVAMMGRVHEDMAKPAIRSMDLPLKTIPLGNSFRSNKTVIQFVNRLFRHVFPDRENSASYEAHHQSLVAPSAELSDQVEMEGEIRVLYTDCKKLRESGKLTVTAEALADHVMLLEARRIAVFLREVYDGKHDKYSSITNKMRAGENAIGVLYRRRTHMYALEQAFKEAELPFTVAKGTQFYQRREVHDAWLLMSFLLDAYDDIALTGLLRSPMISFSDSGLLAVRMVMDAKEHSWSNFWTTVSDYETWGGDLLNQNDCFALEAGVPLLKKLREMVPGSRVSVLLEQAFFTDGTYFGACKGDSQVRENVVKLLEIVRNLENSGRGTLFEITEFMANRIREEARESEADQPDPAPIQMMTIHGSKGLQFPMVVIPDMYAGQNDGGRQLYIADDDMDSIAYPSMAYKAGNREGREDAEASFLYQVLKSESQKRNIAEAKRLFYVAVTRAETHVLLSMARPHRSGTRGTFAGFFEPVLQEGPVRTEDDIQIVDLTVEELEEISGGGSQFASGTDMRQPSSTGKIHILNRKHPAWVNALQQVSGSVVTASGVSQGLEAEVNKTIQPASRWIDLDPADAGTLVHRTLEFGLVEEPTFNDPVENPGSSAISDIGEDRIERFWYRELMKMNYSNLKSIIAQNREELIRHCRNASNAINKTFGNPLSKRYETAFEWTSRKSSGESVTLRGSIDMIIRDKDGQEHIVDIKTGPLAFPSTNINKPENSTVDKLVPDSGHDVASGIPDHIKAHGYDRQIMSYQQAHEAITGNRIPSTRVWLLFTWPDDGRVVPLSEFQS